MQNETIDITYWNLIIALASFAVPLFLFWYYKIRIIKDMLISIVRMIVQLSLVAVYLEWIFEHNNLWINMAWVFVMVLVGVFDTLKRINLSLRYFLLSFALSGFVTIAIIDTFFLGYVIELDYFFDARYFIPITGMILGNTMSHNIVGLTVYLKELREKEGFYYFLLTHTNSKKRTQGHFIKEALKAGLNPLMASMSVIGLISLPGMMTGQILGGSSPVVAIKYQIMIMIAIFVGCTIGLFLGVQAVNIVIFDAMGCINKKYM